MTKQFLIAVAGVAASATFACAQAQTTANLTFRGQITPPACSISTDDATLDFGKRSYTSLSRSIETAYAARQTALNIRCDHSFRVSFSVRDNRANSVFDDDFPITEPVRPSAVEVTSGGSELIRGVLNQRINQRSERDIPYASVFFGLGLAQPNSARIGFLALIAAETGFSALNLGAPMSARLIEGNATPTARNWGRISGDFRKSGGGVLVRPGQHYTLALVSPTEPVAFSSLTLPLSVQPSISPTSTLPAGGEIALDGSVTFTLHYL